MQNASVDTHVDEYIDVAVVSEVDVAVVVVAIDVVTCTCVVVCLAPPLLPPTAKRRRLKSPCGVMKVPRILATRCVAHLADGNPVQCSCFGGLIPSPPTIYYYKC